MYYGTQGCKQRKLLLRSLKGLSSCTWQLITCYKPSSWHLKDVARFQETRQTSPSRSSRAITNTHRHTRFHKELSHWCNMHKVSLSRRFCAPSVQKSPRKRTFCFNFLIFDHVLVNSLSTSYLQHSHCINPHEQPKSPRFSVQPTFSLFQLQSPHRCRIFQDTTDKVDSKE